MGTVSVLLPPRTAAFNLTERNNAPRNGKHPELTTHNRAGRFSGRQALKIVETRPTGLPWQHGLPRHQASRALRHQVAWLPSIYTSLAHPYDTAQGRGHHAASIATRSWNHRQCHHLRD